METRRRQQDVEDRFFSILLGTLANFLVSRLLRHIDRDFGKLTDNTFDVTSDVTDLGKFRGLDLDERRVCDTCESSSDLGLSDTRRADHQNVFWKDVLCDLRRELLASDAISKSDSDGPFGVALSDDVFIELFDDLSGCQVVEVSPTTYLFCFTTEVNWHCSI